MHPPDFSLHLNGIPRIHHCEPWWRWSPPPLPDYDLWCVLEGEGEIRLSGQTYSLRPGICFILPPGETPVALQNLRHRLRVFYAHFEPRDAVDVIIPPEAMRLPPPGILLQEKAFFDVLARRCASYSEQEREPLARRQIALLVEQMLLHLWEESSRPTVNPLDRRLREIVSEIRSQPGGNWSVDVQAERACLSRSQYTRRFGVLFGSSPTAFVIRCRLEQASQLLSETDMTVREVSEVLGYTDLFFFSRQFKSYFGVPPGSIRRADRQTFGARALTAPLSSVKNDLKP